MSKLLVAALAALLLAGCGREAARPEDIRPVRVQKVAPGLGTQQTGYSGEIRPRYETRLAFRVPGKLVSRHVEVGEVVRRGQLLARLDPRDLQLSEQATRAQVNAARAELELAAAELRRYEELRARNFISQAELDRRSSAYATAKARAEQTVAQAAQSENQSSYATLAADTDGVVTALEAEAGQVLAAGQAVVRIARTDEKEVLISVPEHRVEALRRADEVVVRLWADPQAAYAARVREIAPASDPVTRTYLVKIALPRPAPAALRLGMTASVTTRQADAGPSIRLPLTALYDRDRKPAVWVVDPAQGTVSLVPVKTGALAGNEVTVEAGLAPGQLVATAGVHLLREGQKVRILEEGPRPDATKAGR